MKYGYRRHWFQIVICGIRSITERVGMFCSVAEVLTYIKVSWAEDKLTLFQYLSHSTVSSRFGNIRWGMGVFFSST